MTHPRSTASVLACATLVGALLLGGPAAASQDAATPTVTVSGAAQQQNRAPIAVDDSAVATGGASVTVDLFANDSDPDGDALQLVGGTSPASGLVSFDGGVATYTPDAGYRGEDSFAYVIGDGRGQTASAVMRITVRIPVTSGIPKPRNGGPVGTAPTAAPVHLPVTDRAVPVQGAPAAQPAVGPPAAARPAALAASHVALGSARASMGPSTAPYVARPATLPFTGPREVLLPLGLALVLTGGLVSASGRRRSGRSTPSADMAGTRG